MDVKKECCVLIYNSFGDPLFQNVMLPFMRTLASESGWRFHLITFEQPYFEIPANEKQLVAQELEDRHMTWYPRKHHTGKLLIVKKAWDFISIGFLLISLRSKGVRIIWSFANVAASISWVYARILSYRSVIYSYEPHSAFMEELGIWKKSSWNYRILNALEERAGRDADYVLTGTKYMVDHLHAHGAKGEVYRAPTSADESKFYFRTGARKILEQRYSLNESDKLILYVGKFGGLYYASEILLLFRILDENIPDCRFIVVSPNPYDQIVRLCGEVHFDPHKVVYITKPVQEDIKICISGADLGVTAIPPTPSQKYRSPTKVAEYLLCGLPYITTAGVSEDDTIAVEYDVGVVVKDFSEPNIFAAVPEIRNLLGKDKEEMVQRCREVGLAYRAKANVDQILRRIFDTLATS
jgi:hypothetical protein